MQSPHSALASPARGSEQWRQRLGRSVSDNLDHVAHVARTAGIVACGSLRSGSFRNGILRLMRVVHEEIELATRGHGHVVNLTEEASRWLERIAVGSEGSGGR